MSTNPGYADQARKRTAFRVVGVLCMGAALVLIGLAIADFVHAANADDFDTQPTKFWYFFVALPFFAVGGACLNAGFMGAAARYGAGETMPVVKDSASYLSDGQGILGVGRTVDHRSAPSTVAGPYCSRCGVRNDDTAKFCDACGSALG
jgi:hypothetical protein